MKVKEITLHYTEKKSEKYQTAEHGIAITVILEEDETVNDAIAKYQPTMVANVTKQTSFDINRLVQESRKFNS